MKRIVPCLLGLIFIMSLSACKGKRYYVYTNDHNVYIEMPAMTIGIAGPNKVSYGGVSLYDVAEEVFKEFRGIDGLFKKGSYNVYLRSVSKNDYGEDVVTEVGFICTLSTDEMDRYVDRSYFCSDFVEKIKKTCEPKQEDVIDFRDYLK
ncbi:MAG: hypothetical protein K6G08_04460 [Prevotella sp.]|nr:hypothetical protein [Prevotella sp.]